MDIFQFLLLYLICLQYVGDMMEHMDVFCFNKLHPALLLFFKDLTVLPISSAVKGSFNFSGLMFSISFAFCVWKHLLKCSLISLISFVLFITLSSFLITIFSF